MHVAAKRVFDIVMSLAGIVVLSPLLILIAVAVRIDSAGPILFRQSRMGRGMQPFEILKFRTMVVDAPKLGLPITAGADPRITRVGRYLRATKLDELPQLFNILKGEMSIVGPRPEVQKYVDIFPDDFKSILTVRPGLTDLASIKYRDESEILEQATDPEHEYIHRVLPDKISLAKQYVRESSLSMDLRLIVRTFLSLFR